MSSTNEKWGARPWHGGPVNAGTVPSNDMEPVKAPSAIFPSIPATPIPTWNSPCSSHCRTRLHETDLKTTERRCFEDPRPSAGDVRDRSSIGGSVNDSHFTAESSRGSRAALFECRVEFREHVRPAIRHPTNGESPDRSAAQSVSVKRKVRASPEVGRHRLVHRIGARREWRARRSREIEVPPNARLLSNVDEHLGSIGAGGRCEAGVFRVKRCRCPA